MVNRVQTLRSSTPGNRPTGQSPGVLWVTFPDNAFGVVNTSNAAVDLLAIRFFSSLASYVIGDYVKQGVLVYRAIANNGPGAFNASNWSQLQTAADTTFVPLAGGTMTGPLVLNADPSAALGAATKQQVDLKAPLASPVFTGNPTAPTPTAGDNDTSIATTAFVTTATGNSGVVVSDTPPATPPQGKMWFDSAGSQLYVRYDDGTSAQWVIAVNNPPDLSAYATTAYADGLGKSYRNLLRRNGGFEIWQRGAGDTVNTAISVPQSAQMYTADGWYLATNANQSYAVYHVAGITLQSQWAAKPNRIAGQTGVGALIFGFPLDTDEIYPTLGKYVRLSLTLQAAGNWSPAGGVLNVNFIVGTGSPARSYNFTGSTTLIDVPQAITSTPTRYQFNSSVVVPTNVRQAEVRIIWTPVGTAGADDSFTIDDVQLEIVPAATGYVASDFERLNFQEQLALCQRHYWKSFSYGIAPAAAAGTATGEFHWMSTGTATQNTGMEIRNPVPMRVTPTITYWNPQAAGNQIRNLGLGTDCTGTSFNYANANGNLVSGIAPVSTIAPNYMAVHIEASAGI